MNAVKKMIGLYVFGPPLTNERDPLLLKQFKLTENQKELVKNKDSKEN